MLVLVLYRKDEHPYPEYEGDYPDYENNKKE